MRILFLLPLVFLTPPVQDPPPAEESSPLAVVSFKWFKDRQSPENVSPSVGPAPAMISANKNFERQRRINQSAGERDPNQDTIDGRAAALEKAVQDARAPEPINGFAYQVKLRNVAEKQTELIYWEYQFKETANPTNIARRKFVCKTRIKPEKDKEISVFSLLGPSDVISVKSLAKGSGQQFEETVVVNRVEYSDGTSWQRKDWEAGLSLSGGNKSRGQNPSACRSF